MSIRTVPPRKRKHGGKPKGSFVRLLTRAVLGFLLVWGFIYLVNEVMMFGVDKIGR